MKIYRQDSLTLKKRLALSIATALAGGLLPFLCACTAIALSLSFHLYTVHNLFIPILLGFLASPVIGISVFISLAKPTKQDGRKLMSALRFGVKSAIISSIIALAAYSAIIKLVFPEVTPEYYSGYIAVTLSLAGIETLLCFISSAALGSFILFKSNQE